jgi:hypothetical protein
MEVVVESAAVQEVEGLGLEAVWVAETVAPVELVLASSLKAEAQPRLCLQIRRRNQRCILTQGVTGLRCECWISRRISYWGRRRKIDFARAGERPESTPES